MKQVIIIGAGAAGCFAAIEIKKRNPQLQVTLLEKGKHPLAKVAITGGFNLQAAWTMAYAVAMNIEG